MERVYLFARAGDEAKVEIAGRRLALDHVQAREARYPFGLCVLSPVGDAKRRENSRVELDACLVVTGVKLDVVDEVLRPVPLGGGHAPEPIASTEERAEFSLPEPSTSVLESANAPRPSKTSPRAGTWRIRRDACPRRRLQRTGFSVRVTGQHRDPSVCDG